MQAQLRASKVRTMEMGSSIGANEVLALAPTVPDLMGDLRSDHAGEAGAVMIYRGILAGSRDANVRRFAFKHMATELGHLALMEHLVPASRRSILLPAWKLAGWLTGWLPAVVGARAVYATIDAVETFVDRHYDEQIRKLAPTGASGALRSMLLTCQQDELQHRDEARAANSAVHTPAHSMAGGTIILQAWAALVDFGSRAAVSAARRI
jgi:ubiquinone biosynthesis monooxygenase Coq7